MEGPGLPKVNEYDLVAIPNCFHDLCGMLPVEQRQFFRFFLNVTGRFHAGGPPGGPGSGGARCRGHSNLGLHRIEEFLVDLALDAKGFIRDCQTQ